ncbi:hypothetical protein EA462_13455 [Natrarchaeobius halalkaliphilus]|uniref:VOC domain-containing protein n=2 Tax=Natrarchaeobius halalkaliphilus TaxID=1679091 RepID=A0A3N6M026_9EURY|nr:hypothetical protein EA462_13455 [Natrarchaeobius halalkaliphilus]
MTCNVMSLTGSSCDMPGVHRFEHAELGVTDLEEATAFYTDVVGLIEIRDDGDCVYLGSGLDETFDIAIREGDTGIDHFAVRVADRDELERYKARLDDAGVDVKRDDGNEPGQTAGLRFDLPSGTRMELATVEDRRYQHSNEVHGDGRGGAAPMGVDHITLASHRVKDDATFLANHLDFSVSTAVTDDPDAEEWSGAFTRRGDYHHDVAFLPHPDPESTMHHISWEVKTVDHMKSFIDRINQHDVPLEFGIGRHYAGDNVFSYFQTPGGNRIELTAEMATVDPAADTEYLPFERALSAWGPVRPPESFQEDVS